MSTPSASTRGLARRLLAVEEARLPDADQHMHAAVRVCDKLRLTLTPLVGGDGFATFLQRGIVLARAEVPSLGRVWLKPDGSIEGLEALAAKEPDGGAEAAIALTAQILALLVEFIGQPMTLRLVRKSWPDATFDV